MTTRKRTVSNKKIEPEINDSVITPEPEIEPEINEPQIPKLRLLVTEHYTNYAINNGINWEANTEHDVDFRLFQRLMADNPDIFERTA